MEMELQKFLRAGGTIDDLNSKYAISAKRHGKYFNLVLFKYNQIDSPFSEQIVREARGVILDENNNWEIVSRGFNKFFNHGEGHAAAIDWSSASVQEKVDGSLMTVYGYDGKWHVATTGTPDASGEVNGFNITFADLFWKIMFEYGDPFSNNAISPNIGYSFCFEMCSLMNKVVVIHERSNLTVLGARVLNDTEFDDAREISASEAAALINEFGCIVPAVKHFPLGSWDDVIATFETFAGVKQEGYVVVDANFNRVKVKHPSYVLAHKLKDGMTSPRNILDIVRTGEIEEVISYFPEMKELFEDYRIKLDNLIATIESDYEPIKHLQPQKTFAIEAVKTKCPSALFCIRAGKTQSIRQFIIDARIDMVLELIQ